MVSESIVEEPYGPAEPRGVITEEQVALEDFLRRLSSTSSINESGIADETRQDAQLLMSLLFCNTLSRDSNDDIPDSEPLSSSDHSYSSDSSHSRRDIFCFSCPSFSLENPESNASLFRGKGASNEEVCNDWPDQPCGDRPALLLQRPLTVDDRDALRLSADAMARNVLQSFHKAMHWRIQAWLGTLLESLLEKERALGKEGVLPQDLREALVYTPEAKLVLALRSIAEHRLIAFLSASTSFEVQSQRTEGSDDAEPTTDEEATDYEYKVTHYLQFRCDVHLKTPAGFAEISITSPGSVQGIFLSSESDPTPELRSVKIDLNSHMLAAMMEKSCRKIVRSCVEQALQGFELSVKKPAKAEVAKKAATRSSRKNEALAFTTPQPTPTGNWNAVMVTPRNIFADDTKPHSSSKILMPIPDDLDDKSNKPRRISPHPMARSFVSSPPPFGTVTPLKRSSPPLHNSATPSAKRRIPMISPLAGDNKEFHEVPENGPSLPMLVEAACRELRSD